MSARESWNALQNRWAAGEPLSVAEERRRLDGASEDPLAARELELFRELSTRLDQPDDAAPNVALTLAGVRGVKLRVLGPVNADGPVARVSRKRSVLISAGVGGVAVAAAAAFALLTTGDPPAPHLAASARPAVVPATQSRAELVFASGDVRVGGANAVVGKQTLSAGADIATTNGRACLTIDPAVDICLDAQSRVVLESLAEAAVRVRVTRGTAVAALARRKPRHDFSLVGEEVTATAHGTAFALEVDSARHAARVTVVEGSVAVARGEAAARLVSAHSSLALSSSREELAAIGRSEEARLQALLSPRKLWHSENLGVLEIGEGEHRQRVVVDEHGPFELPLRLFVATGRHRVGLRAEQKAEVGLEVEVEAGAARMLSAADVAGQTASPADAVPSAQALLDRARQRLAAGDPRGARNLYRELRRAYPRSSEAATVLVTLGKLELELGAPDRALSAFDAYTEHGGALVPEALSGRIRALRALGRPADERRTIEQYLARYPTGFEASALRKRLVTLTSE
jgi:hypothetical protein